MLPRLCLALVFFCCGSRVHALEHDLDTAVQYAGGIYSSIFFHEAGHALAAKAFGATNIRIRIPREGGVANGITYFDPPEGGFTPGQYRLVAGAGLWTANAAAELVMRREGLHHSRYAQSVLGTALASNVIHVVTYYTRIRGQGGYTGNDIDSVELAGGNPHLYSAALMAYTAWTLQRMKKHDIPFFSISLRF